MKRINYKQTCVIVLLSNIYTYVIQHQLYTAFYHIPADLNNSTEQKTTIVKSN